MKGADLNSRCNSVEEMALSCTCSTRVFQVILMITKENKECMFPAHDHMWLTAISYKDLFLSLTQFSSYIFILPGEQP